MLLGQVYRPPGGGEQEVVADARALRDRLAQLPGHLRSTALTSAGEIRRELRPFEPDLGSVHEVRKRLSWSPCTRGDTGRQICFAVVPFDDDDHEAELAWQHLTITGQGWLARPTGRQRPPASSARRNGSCAIWLTRGRARRPSGCRTRCPGAARCSTAVIPRSLPASRCRSVNPCPCGTTCSSATAMSTPSGSTPFSCHDCAAPGCG
ncbi:hypothetical protein FAGKG844_530014 [Frankia sp. AgKG'84/4]